MGLVHVNVRGSFRDEMLADEQVTKAAAVSKDIQNLLIGKMLEDLPDETKITRRRALINCVDDPKADLLRRELARVPLNQMRHDIDTDILHPGEQQALSHAEVPTSYVHNRPDVAFPDELANELTIGSSDMRVRPGPGIELTWYASPVIALVNGFKSVLD
jgi:hypothetical protein